MKVAYFTNQYPKVSHSFIRREICALEKLGVEIFRIALRTPESELVDERDIQELRKTSYILNEKITNIIRSVLYTAFCSPIRALSTLRLSLSLGWRSERGILLHLIYLIEAVVLADWLSKNNVRHAHAHFGTNSTTVLMLCKELCGVTYSFTVHGPEEFDKPALISLSRKISGAEFVVAISSFGRSQLYRWCNFDRWDRIKIVHCGLEPEFFEGKLPEIRDVPRFVCVGRFCEQKGQMLLIEAINSLKRKGIECKLVLAGDGPMRQDLELLIDNYQLHSNVELTGYLSSNQVRDEILASRALVLPSFGEGLPVVLMEAMALKRPVISTYVAGIPELVEDKVSGWLVPAGDEQSLVDVLELCLETSVDQLNNMGNIAQQSVLRNHSIDNEASKLYSLFKACDKKTQSEFQDLQLLNSENL